MFIEPAAKKSTGVPWERPVARAHKYAAPTELGNIFVFRFYKHSAPTELAYQLAFAFGFGVGIACAWFSGKGSLPNVT